LGIDHTIPHAFSSLLQKISSGLILLYLPPSEVAFRSKISKSYENRISKTIRVFLEQKNDIKNFYIMVWGINVLQSTASLKYERFFSMG